VKQIFDKARVPEVVPSQITANWIHFAPIYVFDKTIFKRLNVGDSNFCIRSKIPIYCHGGMAHPPQGQKTRLESHSGLRF
jgi:hypothetical protein